MSCNLHKKDYHTFSQCAQYPYKRFCKPHTKWVFYDIKCMKYIGTTSGHYLKKVALLVKQNVDSNTRTIMIATVDSS